MKKPFKFILFFSLCFILGCKKDNAPSSIRQKLENNVWMHTVVTTESYPPAECELDNEYTFHFGNNIQLRIDRNTVLCEENEGGWFERRFGNNNTMQLTYNEESEVLIFNSPYEGFKVGFNDDNRLTLTYHNTNPLVGYIPTQYHFIKK